MVSTKHCCWGECKTDSRFPEEWPKSLKELQESGKKVFIPFPKPSQDIAKCKRWLVACSREFFTEKSISRNTYICALHWPEEKGPTAEFPDPLKANFTPTQAARACAPKRKAPKPRVSKKIKLVNEDCGEKLDEFISTDELEDSTTAESTIEATDEGDVTHVYENLSTGKLVSDQGSQTVFSKYELSAKVETIILKNEVSTTKLKASKIISTISYDNIV